MSVVTRSLSVAALAAAVLMGGVGVAQAQTQGRGGVAEAATKIPLKVTVTISRFLGEKKAASLPFTLWVNTRREGASIRMGSDVPVPQATFKDGAPATSYQYRSLGTNIDCSADLLADGLFRISVQVEDSQVSSMTVDGPAKGLPAFQTFKTRHDPILRDGQTVEFAVATDKTSGEVIKLEVTLNVVK